jgi:hypothetical protein
MSETTKIYSVNAKQAEREQLQSDIDRFLALELWRVDHETKTHSFPQAPQFC